LIYLSDEVKIYLRVCTIESEVLAHSLIVDDNNCQMNIPLLIDQHTVELYGSVLLILLEVLFLSDLIDAVPL